MGFLDWGSLQGSEGSSVIGKTWGISPAVILSLCPAPDPQQMQLAPETKGGLASWLQRVQELFQTPVLKLRLVSPASAPEELEDIPAEASALRQGPKLEP